MSQKNALLKVIKEKPTKEDLPKRTHVLQTLLPDAMHWFAGVGYHPKSLDRADMAPIVMNMTSPYLEDAMRLTPDVATQINEVILTEAAGFQVVEYSKALAHYMANPYNPETPIPSIPIENFKDDTTIEGVVTE